MASFDFLSAYSIDRETGENVVEKLRAIAAQRETTPAQVALAWILANPFVTSVILGASNLRQFSDNVKATSLHLSQEEIEELDALTALKPLYPYTLPSGSGDHVREQALRAS
jgi:aryl-alcohol dehydrogenase-like predicted oxidoreductase